MFTTSIVRYYKVPIKTVYICCGNWNTLLLTKLPQRIQHQVQTLYSLPSSLGEYSTKSKHFTPYQAASENTAPSPMHSLLTKQPRRIQHQVQTLYSLPSSLGEYSTKSKHFTPYQAASENTAPSPMHSPLTKQPRRIQHQVQTLYSLQHQVQCI